MKIRTKAGEEIDLSEYRQSLEYHAAREANVALAGFQRRLAVLDALEAALAVPEVQRIAVENEWDKGFEQGFDNARKIIRQAAGVIEEPQG